MMKYKQGDIVRIVLYEQPKISIKTINMAVTTYTEKDLEKVLNALVVNNVGDDEYIVAYVLHGKLIQQSMILR